jgi:hypothetical protein
MERRLAEKSDPDIALLALVRELLREAEAEHDRNSSLRGGQRR